MHFGSFSNGEPILCLQFDPKSFNRVMEPLGAAVGGVCSSTVGILTVNQAAKVVFYDRQRRGLSGGLGVPPEARNGQQLGD